MLKRSEGSIPFLAAVLLGAALLPGQWVPTRQYGTREGLAQSQVNAMVQDARGYLWAATHGGLSRFNGRRFTTFTTLNGLPDDVLSCLAADREGRVWVGADSGRVALWDGRSLRELPEPDPARRTPITALLALPGGRVLLGTESGLWTGSEAGFERADPGPVRGIVADGEGGAWVLGDALARWGGRRLEPFPVELPEPASRLVAVCPDGAAMWMVRDDGLVLHWKDRRWARFQVPVQEPKAAVPRPGGGLWVGGRNGLWLLRPDGRVEYHRLKSNEPTTPVASLLVDREGSLWIGTFTEGMVQEIAMPLTLFTRESGLASTTVWSFAEGPLSGCVWMGSESNGLLGWCEGKGWVEPVGPARGLPSPRAIAVAAAPDGGVWVGTHRGLAFVQGGTVRRVWGAGDGLPDPYIRALLLDPDGALWVGTAGGLARLAQGRWTAWIPDGGMPCPVIRGLARDGRGNLWVATHSCGLLRFDGWAFESFDARRGLPNDRVWCVMADTEDRVWAGTDGGLWVHPQDGRPDFTLGLEHGLPSLNVLFLLQDADGDVWVGTTRGTARLSPAGRVRRIYTATDGFSDSEAAENAALMDRQGRLWFGFAYGVTRVDAGNRDPELPTPVPVIERLLINGGEAGDRFPLAGGAMPEAPTIELEAGASELRFEFAALTFLSPAGVRFRFMLEGYDPEWSMPTEEDHVTYRNIPPGRYRFLVKAMAGKAWSERPAALRLVLHPAWYATAWFRSLAGGGALLLLGGLLWMRIAGERRQKARLEHEVAQRTAELREANRLILEQNRQLEAMSRTDPLTGLGNRRVIEEQLPLEIALQRREMLRMPPGDMGRHFGLALFMLDLDDFKPVNDRLGHDMGDLVLKSVGESFQRSLREVDLCVRWGGDEFLVLCRSLDRKGVLEVTGRLVEEVAHLRISGPGRPAVAVTPSVGFVAYPFRRDGLLFSSQWGLLVQAADRYLYLAKQRGRARACGAVVAGRGEDGVTEEETVRRILASPDAPPAGLEFHEVTVQARLGPPFPTPG
jgi:diguanylate cyclase (GGDEF)-like protein